MTASEKRARKPLGFHALLNGKYAYGSPATPKVLRTPERKLACRTCGAGFLSARGRRPCSKPTPGREYVDTGRGNHVFAPRQPKPPKPPTAEQRARRIGRGLGFYCMEHGPVKGSLVIYPTRGSGIIGLVRAQGITARLWRALERSQRALARERGVKP